MVGAMIAMEVRRGIVVLSLLFAVVVSFLLLTLIRRCAMDLNNYRTDEKLEQEGTWVDFDDGQLLIARMGNHRFQERFNALRKRYKGKLSDEQQKEILIEAMAETVFLGFTNLTDNGEPLENTFENRKAILRVRDVSDFIVEAAQNFENFKQEQDEEDAGNSNMP